MGAVRLYDTPEQFAEMMGRQLIESMQTSVSYNKEEPLLLDVYLDPGDSNSHVQVSLHNTFYTYMNSGDLNHAIDCLNDLVRTSSSVQANPEIMKLDAGYIFPAIRDERYVLEAGRDAKLVSTPFLPGLREIYMEIKGNCCKLIGESLLQHNPRFTEEKVKHLAHKNLRVAGWHPPSLTMGSPTRPTCVVEVYMDPPHPIDCQFTSPFMAAGELPDEYVIAYTNRQQTLVFYSTEQMNTIERALRLVKRAKFTEVVNRSFACIPYPVSRNMYLVSGGETSLLVL